MAGMGKRWLALGLVVATVGIGSRAVGAPARLPIEAKFAEPGPAEVEHLQDVTCGSDTCDLWYPKSLKQRGGYPVITWANGTLGMPARYGYFLGHLASWGFVVVASHGALVTAHGDGVLAAARWMVAHNSDPSSPFHGKLDGRVGAVGHSQGAAAAINAMVKSGGEIRTVVPIELAGQSACIPPDVVTPPCVDTARLRHGSIFLVNGSADAISPSFQEPGRSGLQSNKAYYEAARVTKAWGTVRGADHNDIQGSPDCGPLAPACSVGASGHLGYITAWLRDRLMGDILARQPFVNRAGTQDDGELFRAPGWTNAHSNISS